MKVAVAGGFDIFRIGHLLHLQEAKLLGDKLIVIVARDDQLRKKKGYCFLPFEERVALIKAYNLADDIVQNIDNDSTCAQTLKKIKPDIFAKGGDRTPSNMPQSEIETCKEIGCQILYGIDGNIITSSSEAFENAMQELLSAYWRD